jgi:TonB family protein
MEQQVNDNLETRYRIYGIIGTVLFHVGLYFLLRWILLVTPIPPFPEVPGGGGMSIEVNLGNSEEGMGNIQPDKPSIEKVKTPARPVEVTKEIKTIRTKTTGEQILASENGEATKIKMIDKPVKKAVEPKPEPVVNPNAMYRQPTKVGASQGITGRPGDQGVQGGVVGGKVYTGNPGSGNGGGSGNGSGGGTGNGNGPGVGPGTGSGISYDLGGRSARSLPKPSYNSAEQGRVVVTIWVNREGQVTRVISGAKGTTVTDPSLIQQAESAARRALFSTNPSGPDEQIGKIIYNFLKLN